MITVHRHINLPQTYPLERIGRLDSLLFFDIETTGFSGDTSSLYLIGCTCCRDGNWELYQWFADSPEEEPNLLEAFFSFLKNFSFVIHFNGDGFDIPYLLKRCLHYQLPYDFSGVTSIDIYRKIKPYKTLLGLESLKQKAIERFLGIFRTDPYSGGQLIEVYQEYLMTGQNRLYDMLMLHNKEDLKGMPLILPILNYCDMMEGPFSLVSQECRTMHDIFGTPEACCDLTYESQGMPLILPILNYCDMMEGPFSLVSQECRTMHDIFGTPEACCDLTYESPVFVPNGWTFSDEFFSISCEHNHLICTVPLIEGELKYFYPDYKDYYYLPQEDTAIHKSLGEFVDRSARKKATAATCYTKTIGRFLPQPVPLFDPALKACHKDRQTFLSYTPDLFADPDFSAKFLDGIFKRLCPKINRPDHFS